MEYESIFNQFDSHFSPRNDEPQFENQRYPYIPVEVRLKENKERRLIIQRERQREKQFLLEKRRQKQENIQRALKQKYEAKENAKYIFGNMTRTFNNRLDIEGFKKAEDIDEKIQETRQRAEMYRTAYKRKIHDSLQNRETSVRERKNHQQKEEIERSMEFHLAEWKQYQRKLQEKYKDEPKNPTRMYTNLIKKQDELKQIMNKYKSEKNMHKLQAAEPKKIITRIQSHKNIAVQKQPSNPINSTPDIGSFGLSKSIKNPEKLLQEYKKFLQKHVLLQQPTEDPALLEKFQQLLDEQSKQI